jgi:class 3 adenylate cyclase
LSQSAATRARSRSSILVAADGSVTLMFSDMHDDTGMTERLGDHAALRLVADHNKIVRTQCEAHGGVEVELRGEGFLVAFPTPLSGVRCAVALQRAFEAYSRGHPGQPDPPAHRAPLRRRAARPGRVLRQDRGPGVSRGGSGAGRGDPDLRPPPGP